MLGYLFQTTERGFVVSRVVRVVVVYCMCVRKIRERLVVNVNYFDLRICNRENILIFLNVYIKLSEVGDGDDERAGRLNVQDSLSSHLCMSVGHNIMTKYNYQAGCLYGDQN